MAQSSKPHFDSPKEPFPDAAPSPAPPATGAADCAAEGAEACVLTFDPETVVRGIIFHMIDEGLARDVAVDTVHKALARLRRRPLRPSIRRTAWIAMTNHDRLEWLLAESRTIPLIREDDVVLLSSRDA